MVYNTIKANRNYVRIDKRLTIDFNQVEALSYSWSLTDKCEVCGETWIYLDIRFIIGSMEYGSRVSLIDMREHDVSLREEVINLLLHTDRESEDDDIYRILMDTFTWYCNRANEVERFDKHLEDELEKEGMMKKYRDLVTATITTLNLRKGNAKSKQRRENHE